MSRRRPLAAALTLALVAPVSALTASAATAAPTLPVAATAGAATAAATAAAPAASRVGAKRLPLRASGKGAHRAHDPHTVRVRFKGTAGAGTRARAVQRRGASIGRTLPGTSFVMVHTTGAADELASRLSTDPSVG